MSQLLTITGKSRFHAGIIALIIIAIALPAWKSAAQGKTGKQQKEVVAKIGDYTLSLQEFERQFIKNNGGKDSALKSTIADRKEFLELLVKYRLKVLEAKAKGYDKEPETVDELNEYRNSLAVPYLTERWLIDPAVEKLYKRRLEEVRVAHIMIRIPTDTLGKPDTVSAIKRVDSVMADMKRGISFDSCARRYSDDPNSGKIGGDLGYFLAGMTVPVFDDAIYSMKAGEVTKTPVRTMFGYHIIKLLERQKTRGELLISHILVRPNKDNPLDTAVAYGKIRAILDSLRKGLAKYEDLAKLNSEDPLSGANGGELGWGGRRRYVPEFEAAAFSLNKGQYSDVVRTQFGYHILYVKDERPSRSFEEVRQELKDLYRRYGYDEDNAAFLKEVQKKYAIKVVAETVAKLVENVDTTSTTSAPGWYNKLPEDVKKLPLITLSTGPITVDEAIRTIEKNRDLQGQSLNRRGTQVLAEKLGEKAALMRETANLEKEYPEFGELMQEYREGVLLFRAEQESVWNRVSVTDSALKIFWESRKNDYRWPDRVAFSEIFVTNDSLAKVLYDSLKSGVDFGELASRHTQRAGYKDKKGDWGFQAEAANDLSKKAIKMNVNDLEGPFKFQYGHSIIKVTAKESARSKTFEEASSEVSSRFQEFESKRLEKEWIDGLHKKFGVDVKEELLTKAFKDLN